MKRTFLVERLDTPIERIEIRLLDENTTQPVVIDIQKSVPNTSPSSAEASANSVIEPGTLLAKDADRKVEDRKMASLGGFELKVERKVEHHIVPRSESRRIWENDRHSSSQPEYVDDLPPLDIDDEVLHTFKIEQ